MRLFCRIIVLALCAPVAAVAGPVGDAAKAGDIAEIERLLASGADANEDDALASPLHWAAMNGHEAAVATLVANGARLDAQSNMLGAPLHAAARFNRIDALNTLLAAGADPDVRDRDAFTPLMRAVIENRPDAVRALIAGGADVNAVGNAPGGLQIGKGQTIALQLALRYERHDLADMLRAAGAGALPPPVPADIATLGDPVRGRELAYTYCGECHSIEAGDPMRAAADDGPPLIGLIGRPVADLPGFDYSEALRAYAGAWTADRFYAFALSPALTVPGTRMNWAPNRTREMIADVTAYFLSEAQWP